MFREHSFALFELLKVIAPAGLRSALLPSVSAAVLTPAFGATGLRNRAPIAPGALLDPTGSDSKLFAGYTCAAGARPAIGRHRRELA